jgi:regulator of cell morphogenesis and NO signaling
MNSQPASLAASSLGEIAARLPGATAVFRRHKLDFCCGGGAKLADAVPADRLPAVQAELAALGAEEGAAPQDSAALVAHIVERYHATHRREMPELIRLARRVEAAHRDHPAAPHGLAGLLGDAEAAMEEHMRKEELGLFPMILAGVSHLDVPIGIMRDDHDDHGETLRAIAALTRDHTPPPEACPTWRALCAGTRKFSDDLMEHIHLENNLLFPRFEA